MCVCGRVDGDGNGCQQFVSEVRWGAASEVGGLVPVGRTRLFACTVVRSYSLAHSHRFVNATWCMLLALARSLVCMHGVTVHVVRVYIQHT